ncbi:MAG TPA: hypothetical protein PLH98_09475 [Ruminococcus flavefaciens]|nr:hypothetical protein [Ruminococcus flavefaciens]
MKNYEERIESIFRKYDEKIEAKRRKSALVRRTAFSLSGFCSAAIVGIFVWKMPHTTDIPNSDLVLPQVSATSVADDAFVTDTSASVTTSDKVDTTTNTASTNAVSTTAKKAETTVKSTAITEKTSATTVALMESTTTASKSSKTSAQTSVSVKQSTETTIKPSIQTHTGSITTNSTETTVKNTQPTPTETRTINHTETTTICQYTTVFNTGEQVTTTTTIIKKPDERIILAIENTDYSRSVSEFKNGEKYKYTGNYVKLTDISDFEYIDRFKVYYYFGPIEYEMSSVYKVYTVPNEENKAAVQIDNSDFFLIFEKCIQE